MATYATFAELTQRYGTAALTAMIPPDSTDTLEVLATQAQVEAAAEIDATLGGCGYAVPIDTAAIVDVDQKERAIALLRRIEIGLAVGALSRGEESNAISSEKDDEAGSRSYQDATTEADWAMAELEAICSRKAEIPGVFSPGKSFLRHSELAVPAASDVADRIERAGAW